MENKNIKMPAPWVQIVIGVFLCVFGAYIVDSGAASLFAAGAGVFTMVFGVVRLFIAQTPAPPINENDVALDSSGFIPTKQFYCPYCSSSNNLTQSSQTAGHYICINCGEEVGLKD